MQHDLAARAYLALRLAQFHAGSKGGFARKDVEKLLTKLFKQRIAFIDGAMGTEIQKYKLQVRGGTGKAAAGRVDQNVPQQQRTLHLLPLALTSNAASRLAS